MNLFGFFSIFSYKRIRYLNVVNKVIFLEIALLENYLFLAAFPYSMWHKTAERRLRHECLDEILGAVEKKGIELTYCSISAYKVDRNPLVDNTPRRALEELKTKGARYSLEIRVEVTMIHVEIDKNGNEIPNRPKRDSLGRILDEYGHLPVPADHYLIGYTSNPEFDMEQARFAPDVTVPDHAADRSRVVTMQLVNEVRVVPPLLLPVYLKIK